MYVKVNILDGNNRPLARDIRVTEDHIEHAEGMLQWLITAGYLPDYLSFDVIYTPANIVVLHKDLVLITVEIPEFAEFQEILH